MKEYKLAVVGATGLVGRKVIEVLEEYNLPISNIEFFASRRSAGIEFFFKGKQRLVQELKESSFDEGFDFAIFSAGSDISKKFAPIAASKGCIVVDNSSAFRMDPEVPLVVPEVNPEEIFKNKGIIANPNCSTIQAVIPLKALDKEYSIKRIVYSTYQAVSGSASSKTLKLEGAPVTIKAEVDQTIDIADVRVEGATIGEDDEIIPGEGRTYVLIYLNDHEDQSKEMGASFTGQLIYSSKDGSGNELTGTFKVAGNTEEEGNDDTGENP